jgi:hypothetical protein
MGKLNSRRGLYIGLSVGRAAGWRGLGVGVGFGGKGKKSPALGTFSFFPFFFPFFFSLILFPWENFYPHGKIFFRPTLDQKQN